MAAPPALTIEEANDLFYAEMLSTISMTVVATWTVSTASYRALSTRALLQESGEIQPVIDMKSALMLPIISSATLLILFFLFKYIQSFMVLYMSVASFGAVSMCLYEPISIQWPRIVTAMKLPSFLACGRSGTSKWCSFIACLVVAAWLLTGHWLALDILGVSITIGVISLIRLPSLKIASIVLLSLFIYDIFWVFYSSYFFGGNVMVEVATKKAENPVQALAENFDIPMMKHATHTLQLPIKLMFPAGVRHGLQTFHMLGLGDMAIPGIFLAFALSFDSYLEFEHGRSDDDALLAKRRLDEEVGLRKQDLIDDIGLSVPNKDIPSIVSSSSSPSSSLAVTPPSPLSTALIPTKCAYFRCAQVGYVTGIVMSITASMVFGVAQPALLYLVPCVLLPIIIRAKSRSHLKLLWLGFSVDENNEEINSHAA